MNRNASDSYVESSSEQSLADTHALISHIRSHPVPLNILNSAARDLEPLVQPILTPRFAISTTRDLLTSLGQLAAADSSLRIQTHISENLKEIEFTKELYPQSTSYAGVYDDHGLLRENTILAHAVHLEETEIELIKARKAGISHCPTSNFNLSSGIAPIGKYLDHGLKVFTPNFASISGRLHTTLNLDQSRHRCFRWILAFNFNCYPTCQHRIQGNEFQCLAIDVSVRPSGLFLKQTTSYTNPSLSCNDGWRRGMLPRRSNWLV